MKGLLITGTDTGVGKTVVSCAILELLRRRGLRPAPFKPCESGCEQDRPEDALAMRDAAGSEDPIDEVCPYRLRLPLGPAAAAEAEGTSIDLERLLSAYARLTEGYRPAVVESAGGLLVPLAPALNFADLAERLDLPVLVVARDALGTLNHTALTVEALRRRGLHVAAVVLNRLAPIDDGTWSSNAAWIRNTCNVETIVQLDHRPDPAQRRAHAVERLEGLVERLLHTGR